MPTARKDSLQKSVHYQIGPLLDQLWDTVMAISKVNQSFPAEKWDILDKHGTAELKLVYDHLQKLLKKCNRPHTGRKPDPKVSKRRKAVAELLEKGLKPGVIASQLGISASTVYKDKERLG